MRKDDIHLILATMVTMMLSRCCTMPRSNPLETLFSWKMADYVFPNDAPRDSYINAKQFIPENVLILDASVWDGYGQSRKVFVSTPRLRNGIPASLSIVTSKSRNDEDGNLLQPYPDWSWHRKGDCNGMTSVFRTTVDECGRLWVLDTGYLHAEAKQVCPPQILIFNLHTDWLIDRYVFPKDVITKDSLLITIVVDKRESCEDVFAYIADVTEYKLIVYDRKNQKSWRIDSHLFFPYPIQGVFNINGVMFDLMDGLFGLALGPLQEDNDRTLFFHSLASIRESWVQTSIIRNESLFKDGTNLSPRSFKVSNDVRSSQSASEAMSDNGVLFFGLLTKNALACWNSQLPYSENNIETVAQDNVRLQFISGLKIHNGNVWVTSSRFQNYFTGVMDGKEVNFRILRAPVKQLVVGTSCMTSGYKPSLPITTPFRPFPSNPYTTIDNRDKPFTFKP